MIKPIETSSKNLNIEYTQLPPIFVYLSALRRSASEMFFNGLFILFIFVYLLFYFYKSAIFLGFDNYIFKTVLKSLGICYITSFSADMCKDFGQTSLAGKIELAGKIAVVVISIPLINEILNSALELIE